MSSALRLHPDDVRAIAEQVAALLQPDTSEPGYISPAEEARIRQLARENSALLRAKKAERHRSISAGRG